MNVSTSIRLKNRLTDLEKIRGAVEDLISGMSCTKRKFKEIDLVLEELFVNVVRHGFVDDKEHEIKLTLGCENDMLIIRMEDDGRPFNILEAEPTDTRCPIEKRCVGGLGIQFVKHFTDHCEYHRKNGKNIVLLKKKILGSCETVKT